MAKRKSKSRNSGLTFNESGAKAVIAFLVLLIAFGVFILFNNNQDSLMNSSSLQFFIVLVVVLFALLAALLFLLNPQKK